MPARRVRLRCPGEKSSGPAGRRPRRRRRAARGLRRRADIGALRGRGSHICAVRGAFGPAHDRRAEPIRGRRHHVPARGRHGPDEPQGDGDARAARRAGSRRRPPRAVRRARRRAGHGDHDGVRPGGGHVGHDPVETRTRSRSCRRASSSRRRRCSRSPATGRSGCSVRTSSAILRLARCPTRSRARPPTSTLDLSLDGARPGAGLDDDLDRQPLLRSRGRRAGRHSRQGLGLGLRWWDRALPDAAVAEPEPAARHRPEPLRPPVQTGNDGVVAEIQRRADVAIADHECPDPARTGSGRPRAAARSASPVPRRSCLGVAGHARASTSCTSPRTT